MIINLLLFEKGIMSQKTCQIVLVGHNWQKLIYSIDKEIFDKLIFITEKKEISGTKKAKKALNTLLTEYNHRKINVEERLFSFHISNKPIAEMVHLIYQQKQLGFNNIIINLSGGLRYMDIWMYLAACLTNSKIIHGDFIYDEDKEVGIQKNDSIDRVDLGSLTPKQFQFLSLFFKPIENLELLFDVKLDFDQNLLLSGFKHFESIEEMRIELNEARGEKLTRGSINGYINKLERISALKISKEEQNKRKISINYFGIAYFLKKAHEKL